MFGLSKCKLNCIATTCQDGAGRGNGFCADDVILKIQEDDDINADAKKVEAPEEEQCIIHYKERSSVVPAGITYSNAAKRCRRLAQRQKNCISYKILQKKYFYVHLL